MSAAEGRRCTENPPSAALTWEDIDATIDYLRHGMLWDMSGYVGPHVGDSDASRLTTSQMMINKVIEDIGEDVGRAADELVLGTLRPIQEAPHLDPDLVWRVSRAFWHEVVHRGMEIGRSDSYWIKGLGEFPYDDVLMFAQHIWLAFKHYTGLDFTVPEESKTIKTWLSLSPRLTQREIAPDTLGDDKQERKDRLEHYVEHGGPSRRLMGEVEEGRKANRLSYEGPDTPPGDPEAQDVTFGSGHVGVTDARDD